MARLRIGCSGWSYKHWRGGAFYPAGQRAGDELAYYASRFDTAEINASFYRLPTEAAVDGWRERSPPGFLFAWKASRFITHMKRLLDPDEPLALMFSRADRLGDKLGPVLFQLPPKMARDDERLARFLDALPPGRRHAFEFRHPSWYDEAVFALLAGHDAALCVSDHHHAPAPRVRTASWAARIGTWRGEGHDVVCYFDNDPEAAAPRDAEALIELCRQGPRSLRP
jgi:uncharacterized protein YecE (DUF72 family)